VNEAPEARTRKPRRCRGFFVTGCATAASAISQRHDNQQPNDPASGWNGVVYCSLRWRRNKGRSHMELHFMIIAILVLTLIAAFAIRRAEEEIIEGRELDRRGRNEPSA
jgi:hypothetical protein